jgi:DNA-directed RNA polymerase beta' subunit
MYNIKEKYEPGYPLGIITAQSITQPLTQDTLSSFHKTGSLNYMIENVNRFKELTQNINNNYTSICDITLTKNLNYMDIYLMFVYKNLSSFIKNIIIFDTKKYKKYWFKKLNIKDNYNKII